MASASPVIDAMVKEYLIFRGFTNSLKSFDADRRNDRNKMFKVENIVQQFSNYIHTYDVTSLKSYWTHFDTNYFSRLGHDAHKVVKKIEVNLLRFYIVHALQTNKSEKVQEFFEKYATELCQEDCWKEWFLIPFMKNPETSKTFSVYFTKIWQDSVLLSLSNCFDTIFTHMKRPLLLNFEDDYHKLKALTEENRKLKDEITSLQKDLNRFKTQQLLDKVEKSVQTNMELDEMHVEDKNRRKPTRFGWKLLGSTKEKDTPKTNNKSVPLKETGNSLLRNSLDENAMRKLMTTTNNTQQTLSSAISEEENVTHAIDVAAAMTTIENQSTFYASLSNSYKKSLSFAGYSNNNTKQDNSKIVETPFILLGKDEFKEHNSPILSSRFSENGNTVASLDTDGILKLWDFLPTISKTAVTTLKENILSFDWLHNVDNKILLGRNLGTLTIYDTLQRKFLWEVNAHPKFKSVSCVACSPISNSAVCSILAPIAKKTKESMQSNKMIRLKQYTSFSESASTRQGALSVWDLQSGQHKCDICLDPYPVSVHSLSYNHNGSLIVTGGADGMVRLFDAHNSDCLVGWHAHTTSVLDVIFSADETSIYSLGSDGKLCVWDINKVSNKISEFPLPISSTGFARYNNERDLGNNFMEDMPYIKLLANHSDGEHLMTCGEQKLVIYKASLRSDLEEIMSLEFPKTDILTVDWSSSPNCSTALCGCKDGTVYTATLLKR